MIKELERETRRELTEFNWLTDTRYAKLKSQLRRRIDVLLSTAYSMHGYKEYAPGVAYAIMEMVEESWDIVRGKEKPLPEPNIRRWE